MEAGPAARSPNGGTHTWKSSPSGGASLFLRSFFLFFLLRFCSSTILSNSSHGVGWSPPSSFFFTSCSVASFRPAEG
ncbi:hypothetical protein EYF80_028228 [Liparis tanakae]|uniref:Uncharacterized protein n=1 Tax=Liparis tanakae TaxID=230148 RepID=A0A4Z2H8X1_9TELE|nr:hypothetical protein EYF80_028228 [Liparis tanakae]